MAHITVSFFVGGVVVHCNFVPTHLASLSAHHCIGLKDGVVPHFIQLKLHIHRVPLALLLLRILDRVILHSSLRLGHDLSLVVYLAAVIAIRRNSELVVVDGGVCKETNLLLLLDESTTLLPGRSNTVSCLCVNMVRLVDSTAIPNCVSEACMVVWQTIQLICRHNGSLFITVSE